MTLALVGGVVSFTPLLLNNPPPPPRESAPGTHCIGGGWAGPRAILDDMEKLIFLILPGLEP
jgi:hypothetical protein